jgi:hypothetical protein
MKRFWPKLKRLVRVPSFQLAYGANVAVLLAFIAWLFIDAQFWLVLHCIATCVGLDTCEWSRAFLRWDSLGPRAVVFVALAVIGIVAIAIVFGRLFIGQRSGRSVAAWMAAVALLALWLSAFISVDGDTGAEYRVRRDLERFQTVVAALEREQYGDRISLPSGGMIRAAASRINEEFFVEHVDSLSRREAIGMGYRLTDGGYLFLLQTRLYTIEYHPGDMRPAEFPVPVKKLPISITGGLRWESDLGDGWFLTRYRWEIEKQ